MDFSVFERRNKALNETCEVIVVDFINKRVQCRVTINNLNPNNIKAESEIMEGIEAIKNIKNEYIENSINKEVQEQGA